MDINSLRPFPGLGGSLRVEILTQSIEAESMSTSHGVTQQTLNAAPRLHAWCAVGLCKMPGQARDHDAAVLSVSSLAVSCPTCRPALPAAETLV